MALVLKDRVRETTNTAGTGTLTLLGAVTGYQTFSAAIGNTNTCYYAISATGSTLWEVGLGTVAAGTLARTTILASSAAGAAITLPGTTFDVFVTYPAGYSVYADNATNIVTQPQFTANRSTTASTNLGAFNYGTLGYSDTDILAAFTSSTNSYNQLVVQNTNAGASASADLTISNNSGTATTNYANFGINSSGWTGVLGTNSFSAPSVSYVSATSADLVIGTVTNNNIRFVTNNSVDAFAINTNYSWAITGTTLSTTTTLPLASAGNMNFAARQTAGKLLPTWRGPSGLPYYAQAGIGSMQWQSIYSPGNVATTFAVYRANAPTNVGTLTSRTVASTNAFTRARRLGIVSVATAGGLASSYEPTVAQFTLGDGTLAGGFYYVVRFGISDAATVAGARMFLGLTSVVTAPTNVEPNTLTNAIGIAQLSTDATQLYVVYGGSAAQTAVAVGTNFPANTLSTSWYEFIMYAPTNSANTVYWQINNLSTGNTNQGTLTGTAGTVLPANTTFLAQRAWRTNNATALAVGLDIGSIYIETDM
jgi:hypothetical protein